MFFPASCKRFLKQPVPYCILLPCRAPCIVPVFRKRACAKFSTLYRHGFGKGGQVVRTQTLRRIIAFVIYVPDKQRFIDKVRRRRECGHGDACGEHFRQRCHETVNPGAAVRKTGKIYPVSVNGGRDGSRNNPFDRVCDHILDFRRTSRQSVQQRHRAGRRGNRHKKARMLFLKGRTQDFIEQSRLAELVCCRSPFAAAGNVNKKRICISSAAARSKHQKFHHTVFAKVPRRNKRIFSRLGSENRRHSQWLKAALRHAGRRLQRGACDGKKRNYATVIHLADYIIYAVGTGCKCLSRAQAEV